MFFDTSSLPLSPAVVLVVLGYAGLSGFVTGPEIAAREIERSGWKARCEARLTSELHATAPHFAPRTPDQAELCGLLGAITPELEAFCTILPDPNAAARAAENHLRSQKLQRFETALASVGDQCRCAEAVYLEEERLPLALYAGSLRIITPPSVKTQEDVLYRALRAPSCNMAAGAVQ